MLNAVHSKTLIDETRVLDSALQRKAPHYVSDWSRQYGLLWRLQRLGLTARMFPSFVPEQVKNSKSALSQYSILHTNRCRCMIVEAYAVADAADGCMHTYDQRLWAFPTGTLYVETLTTNHDPFCFIDGILSAHSS